DQLAGQPAGLSGDEEGDDVRDVLRGSDASQWGVAVDSGEHVGADPAGLDRAGGHDVDGDSGVGQLVGRGSAQAFQRVLCGAVGDLAGEGRGAVGADVDDAAPAGSAFQVPAVEFGHQDRRCAGVDRVVRVEGVGGQGPAVAVEAVSAGGDEGVG